MSVQQIGWTVRGHERRMKEQAERLEAENQRLRDALERITRWDYDEGADNNPVRIARAALAGTPSEDTYNNMVDGPLGHPESSA
jgi:hypothetical protein